VSAQVVAQIKSRCFWNFPGQTDRETPGILSVPEEEYFVNARGGISLDSVTIV